MKPCVKCGKMLPDAANFCTDCGSQQNGAGPEVDRWGTPKPAQTVRQVRQQMPLDTPTADTVPAVREKKRGFRARHVVILLVIAVLAAAGAFVWRALQHPSEIWQYNEDGELFYIEYYDGADVIRGVEYDDDENVVYMEEYRETDEAKAVDTASVEAVDGVKSTRTIQVFCGDSDQEDLEDANVFLVIGSDWRGRTVVYETYWRTDDGEYVLLQVTNYEWDVYGNMTHMERTCADGTLLMEADYENHYSFGRLVSRDVDRTSYGYAHVDEQGKVESILFEEYEVREVSQTYEMHY